MEQVVLCSLFSLLSFPFIWCGVYIYTLEKVFLFKLFMNDAVLGYIISIEIANLWVIFLRDLLKRCSFYWVVHKWTNFLKITRLVKSYTT